MTAVLVPNDLFRALIGTEALLRNYVFGVIASGVVEVMNLVEEIAFKKLDVRLAELPGTVLGMASGLSGTIWLDTNAAGHGWYVDAAPSYQFTDIPHSTFPLPHSEIPLPNSALCPLKPDTCLRSRLKRSVSGETNFPEQKRGKKLNLYTSSYRGFFITPALP